MTVFHSCPVGERTVMSEHLKRRRYGCFQLTDALRPALDLRILPEEGYRRSLQREAISGIFVPMVTCAASGEHLFDIFLETRHFSPNRRFGSAHQSHRLSDRTTAGANRSGRTRVDLL